MQHLLVEQRGPSGLIKTWRLRPEQERLTFGHSKHADLRSPLETIKGIQGIFEYRAGQWFYVNLDAGSDFKGNDSGDTDLKINQPSELRLGISTVSITPYDARSPLFEAFDQGEVARPGNDKHPFQLFTVHQNGQLLETKVIPIHQTFVTAFDPSSTVFNCEKLDQWKKTVVGDLVISQRTVFLNDTSAFKTINTKDMLDDTGKKSLIGALMVFAFMASLAVFGPQTPNALEEALTPVPPPREITMEPKKPKKEKQSTPKDTPTEKNVAAAPRANKGGASRSASAIKALSSGRISKLVGKVSAAAARSANVVVTSGIKAGTAPTGRALAAVGAINKSGTDWTAEGKGTGITISTKGKAGGLGVAGLGKLSAGKTGTGGVGLLEEEGEIIGGLDREVIAQYIRSQLGQILYCYERQLSANPDLYGKVAIKFTIGGDGSVETQRIGDTTLKNATVEGCILQRVAKWKFPQPEGGTKVNVTYPFLFKSTN